MLPALPIGLHICRSYAAFPTWAGFSRLGAVVRLPARTADRLAADLFIPSRAQKKAIMLTQPRASVPGDPEL